MKNLLSTEEKEILEQVQRSGYTAPQLAQLLEAIPKVEVCERCKSYGLIIRNMLANAPGLDEKETAALYYLFDLRETLKQVNCPIAA